jgi:hypothetical protein
MLLKFADHFILRPFIFILFGNKEQNYFSWESKQQSLYDDDKIGYTVSNLAYPDAED